jgi:hypothetical protein
MIRLHRLVACLALGIVTLAVILGPMTMAARPAAAATPPPAVSGGARIDEPRASSVVRGTVKIMGTASLPTFAKYQMYIQRPGSNAFEWKFERNQAVVNGLLWEWNTNPRDYPDGNYVIRMWVVKADGNYDEVTVAVRVDNATTPTPIPATPTPAAAATTPTPAVSPTPIVVSTPVVIGVQATATAVPSRVAATATPLFGIDIAKVVDPAPWVRAFTTGMVLAAAGIAFIFALFIARALLSWRP